MSATLKQKSFNSQRQVYEYDIVDPDGKKVGLAQLRLIPSKNPDMPAGFESHVYYEVDPPYRDHNYATEALQQMLEVAKKHKINPVVATSDEDNIASIKVIEKCGGQQVGKGKTTDGQTVLKYHLPTI